MTPLATRPALVSHAAAHGALEQTAPPSVGTIVFPSRWRGAGGFGPPLGSARPASQAEPIPTIYSRAGIPLACFAGA